MFTAHTLQNSDALDGANVPGAHGRQYAGPVCGPTPDVPSGHGTPTALPGAEKKPAGSSVQAVPLPAGDDTVPAAHTEQLRLPNTALTEPGAHNWQGLTPVGETEPGAHSGNVAIVDALYWPNVPLLGMAEHCARENDSTAEPVGHGEHDIAPDPAANWPGMHAAHGKKPPLAGDA